MYKRQDTDTFTGDNSTVSFTLSKDPKDARNVLVTLDGVVQYPSTPGVTKAYDVSENVLTFTAPPALDVDISVRHIGFAGPSLSGSDSGGSVGIQSSGTTIDTDATTLNFIGIGNTFAVRGRTVDISIESGGGGAGAGGTFAVSSAGIHTVSSVGVNTTALSDALVGSGSSFQGIYVSNGMMIMDNTLNGNHYIGTAFNGLMAGPVNIDGVLTIDGNYVVV